MPWIRTGPSGQTYEAYNNYDNAGGRSASIRVSANNGATFAPPVTLETVDPAAGQDAPPVRQAVNGSTVYAAFTRWGDVIQDDANGVRFEGDVTSILWARRFERNDCSWQSIRSAVFAEALSQQ